MVKSKGENQNEKDLFAFGIAEATNAQKPIKKADLKSNTPEQLRLRERLGKKQVYYITKKGDKVPRQYSQPYQSAKLETVGKLSLAAVLQMPGSARTSSQKMYNDEYYYSIFGEDAREGVIADLLKISYYYECFLHTQIKDKGYDERTALPMIKNGKTFQIACIAFLCKICNDVFPYDTVQGHIDDIDVLKSILRKMENMTQIIVNHLTDEQERFYEIFAVIGDEVLGTCYDDALQKAEEAQTTLAPSDYLKRDTNYYHDVLKRLWRVYKRNNNSLQKNIDAICVKK